MFGHQNDTHQAQQDADVQAVDSAPIDLGAVDAGAPAAAADPLAAFSQPAPEIVAPVVPSTTAPDLNVPAVSPVTFPAIDTPTTVADPIVAANPVASAPVATSNPDTDQLLDIKQQALQQLSPLVNHLEQSPEEKFRTTMMMIQAADNHDLVKTAYDAAQAIPDEKVRAQALLDVVNEINYFTHRDQSQS